jgi:hypothetical protein
MDDLPVELRAVIMREALRSMDFRIKMGVINKLSCEDFAGRLKGVLARGKIYYSWKKNHIGMWFGWSCVYLREKYSLHYDRFDELKGDNWSVSDRTAHWNSLASMDGKVSWRRSFPAE